MANIPSPPWANIKKNTKANGVKAATNVAGSVADAVPPEAAADISVITATIDVDAACD